ncbi:hypothetical protein JHK87_024978 [Glycine soja]|nr:hypothetical protein JHK87_024978 [Glycine soja]
MWPFRGKGASGFSSSSTAEEVTHGIDGSGLTAIVTGASSGIGAETARVLALRGVHVIMGVIDMTNAENVKESILKEIPIAKIDVMKLDLSSMASKTTQESKKQGRIVNVSSAGHRLAYREGILFDKINDQSSYNNWLAYGQSKLANILHSNELARRFKEDGIDIIANSLHPGATTTNIYIHNRFLTGIFYILGPFVVYKLIAGFLLKNVQQGAATTCYVALHPQVSGISGKYFVNSNISEAHSQLGRDMDLAKKLWDFSINLTKPNT